MNLDDIRPRKRPSTHPINDELKHLARSKRLSRGTIATLLGVQRHHVNNWMDTTPQSRTPQHQLTRLKEILNVSTKT